MNVDRVDLPSVDLNLLKVFVTIMSEKSITTAGSKLGLTQSATSNALNRLRTHCQDPLFVRTSMGMEPTALALELIGPITESLNAISRTFEQRASFDAGSSTRTFRILQTNFGELQCLPELISRVRKSAPSIRIEAMSLSRDHYREALELNRADLAMGHLPTGQFVQQHLYDDPLVCVMREGHALQSLGVEEFFQTPQLMVADSYQVEFLIRRALGKKLSERQIALKVSSTVAIAPILEASDLIAVMPSRWCRVLPRRENFKVFELPFDAGKLVVRQFWHQRNHHDPGHKWLRGQIAAVFHGHNSTFSLREDETTLPAAYL